MYMIRDGCRWMNILNKVDGEVERQQDVNILKKIILIMITIHMYFLYFLRMY